MHFEDATAEALEWLRQIQTAPSPGAMTPKAIDLRDVIGGQVGPMLKNMGQNFLEGRTGVVRALVQKIH